VDQKRKCHAEYLKWSRVDDMAMLARSHDGKSGSHSEVFG
jgi:hypothetical protein